MAYSCDEEEAARDACKFAAIGALGVCRAGDIVDGYDTYSLGAAKNGTGCSVSCFVRSVTGGCCGAKGNTTGKVLSFVMNFYPN